MPSLTEPRDKDRVHIALEAPNELTPLPTQRSHGEVLRIVTYLMLVRTALATVLMLSVVMLAFVSGSPETLAGPYGRFVFALLATTYLASLAYALTLHRIADPIRFADIQIGVDLILVTMLVHATGGAQSGYTFLYLIDVVAVSALPRGFGATSVAVAATLMYLGISLLGYLRVLPPITGQTVFPWDMTREEFVFRILLFSTGLVSVGSLGVSLARQRRKAGERLVQQQQIVGDLASLHQNTIRCLSSGLVTTTLDGNITMINDAACEILGITASHRPLGRNLKEYIPGITSVMTKVGILGRVLRDEVDAIREDGVKRCLGLSATPLSDHTNTVIGRVVHFQDLTELRRMELVVARAEHLAGIGRLAANIAHEIRNPLASISGSVEVLKSFPGVDKETRNLIDITVREVDRVNALITGLLDYARPRAEDRQRLDLAEIVMEVAMIFDRERRACEITLIQDLAREVWVDGGQGQLRQVIWNLLRNAVEAMPEGGKIHIRVEQGVGMEGHMEAWLTIRDTGTGIAQADIGRIFEPFFSRKPNGTGLGLATTARIMEEHSGSIDVTSDEGKGTTFLLRFPLAKDN